MKHWSGLEIIIFRCVYCARHISDTVYTGNSDVYAFSHLDEICIFQSKVNRLTYLLLDFNLFMLTVLEHWLFSKAAAYFIPKS